MQDLAEIYRTIISTPGKMYGLVKTHKVNNPVRVITSGGGMTVGILSIFVERCYILKF